MIDYSFPEDQITFDDIQFCPDGSAKNVLVACEESQEVCKAFRALGHRAFSCDIQECSGGHPEWHVMGDVLPLLNGSCEFVTQDGHKEIQLDKWDIVIAHPPCTHLAVSGARHFETKRKDGRQREAVEFFCRFLNIRCDHVMIENPIGIISGDYVTEWFPDLAEKYGLPIQPSQIIQPYEYGHATKKSTCLWLKGLPRLKPTNVVDPEFVEYKRKDGGIERFGKGIDGALRPDGRWYSYKDPITAKMRSKTFHGIAVAMAEQWGGKVKEDA